MVATSPARLVGLARAARARMLASPQVSITDAAGTWLEVEPARPYALSAEQLGARPAGFARHVDATLPALGVLSLAEGSVTSAHGWVHDRDGRLLVELSWYGRHGKQARDRERPPRRPVAPDRLPGRTLTLGTNWGGHYGHFLHDAVGRLAIVEAAGLSTDDFDWILLPRPESAGAWTVLDRLQLDPSRVKYLETATAVVCDTLIAPSFPGARRQFSPLVGPFLQRLEGYEGVPSRRLYVGRRGYSRDVTDAEAVERVVTAAGFEIFDVDRCENQPRAFAEADVVVGPGGSALHNVAFCRPGSTVVELISEAHDFPYIASIAQSARLRYGYVVGSSTEEARALGPSKSDFAIDLDELRAALEWALGRHAEGA